MADEMYDSDGDVSRYLQSPGPESHLLAADELEATHVGAIQHASAAPQVQARPAPQMPNDPAPAFGFQAPDISIEHQQAPAPGFQAPDFSVEHQQEPASGFQAPTINVERHQAPVMAIQSPQMLAPEQQPAYGVPNLAHMQDAGVDDTQSWIEDMLDSGIGSPSLYEDFINDGEEEVAAALGDIEEGDDISGAEAGPDVCPVEEDPVFVPFVRGQLDCTRCRSLREILHKSENHKTHFIVHGADPGQFQHAIMDRMRIGADGQTQTVELLYLDLRKRTQEWVQNFIANTVEMLKSDNSGQLQDICSSFGAAACTNINAPLPNSNEHMELEVDMLRSMLSAPAANAEGASPETSQPVTEAEENTNAEFDWAGFYPEILESSHCTPYDPETSTGALIYPSLRDKRREREQARLSTLSIDDATKYFKKSKEDDAKEINLSSASFKLLCRKDNSYRIHARRIHGINRKITKLEQTAQYLSSSGLFVIKQKMEMYKHEKAQIYAEIMKGLQEYQKGDDGAGPSGTK